jgi:hypothetical protein
MDSVLNLVGLMYRARKLVLGDEVYNRLKDIKLLLIANDISKGSRERLLKKTYYYQIDYLDKYSGEELSMAIGKNNVKIIGIIDDGFKKSLINKI